MYIGLWCLLFCKEFHSHSFAFCYFIKLWNFSFRSRLWNFGCMQPRARAITIYHVTWNKDMHCEILLLLLVDYYIPKFNYLNFEIQVIGRYIDCLFDGIRDTPRGFCHVIAITEGRRVHPPRPRQLSPLNRPTKKPRFFKVFRKVSKPAQWPMWGLRSRICTHFLHFVVFWWLNSSVVILGGWPVNSLGETTTIR